LTTRAESIVAAKPRARTRRRRPAFLPYLLAVPILAYEAVFLLYPIYQGIHSSFTKQVSIGKPATWVGLANYRRMLHDPTFWSVMGNTIVYMVAVIVVAIGFGLGSALVLNRPFRGRAPRAP